MEQRIRRMSTLPLALESVARGLEHARTPCACARAPAPSRVHGMGTARTRRSVALESERPSTTPTAEPPPAAAGSSPTAVSFAAEPAAEPAAVPAAVPAAAVATAGALTSRASQVRASRYSTRAAERLSVRGPRLTLADGDGGGRPRVVSLLDAFTAPSEQYDYSSQRASQGADQRPSLAGSGGGSGGSCGACAPPAWKPSLPTLKSTGNVLAAADAIEKGAGAPAAAGGPPPTNPLRLLLRNGVYSFTVLALCSLFFVVTGVQFWVTSYIVVVIGDGGSKVTQADVTPAFGVTSIVAPILGVFAGGAFIDNIGGYKGESAMALTLKCCFAFALCAAGSAIACAYVPRPARRHTQGAPIPACVPCVPCTAHARAVARRARALQVPASLAEGGDSTGAFWACIGLIASTLIFGGAIIPAAMGCLVAAVPPEIRQLSSAASMFCFQQFGYMASPLLSAVVASFAADGSTPLESKKANLKLGFQCVTEPHARTRVVCPQTPQCIRCTAHPLRSPLHWDWVCATGL